MTRIKTVAVALTLSSLLSGRAVADEPAIKDIVVAPGISDAQRNADLTAVRVFYGFWNDGDASRLDHALAQSFTDRTLPSGRPQGPAGPAFASKHFRAAVPDLHVSIEKLLIEGEYATVHMIFSGHFTGDIGKVHGSGQPIRFIATDLLKIANGHITDNWHIEDNLTLFQQMGVAKLGM